MFQAILTLQRREHLNPVCSTMCEWYSRVFKFHSNHWKMPGFLITYKVQKLYKLELVPAKIDL